MAEREVKTSPMPITKLKIVVIIIIIVITNLLIVIVIRGKVTYLVIINVKYYY